MAISDIIRPSDVLRTVGAVFLLTRQSTIAKVLGVLWLGGEVVALAQREGAVGGAAAANIAASNAAVVGDKRIKTSFDGYLGYAG